MPQFQGIRISQERVESPWRSAVRWLMIALGVVIAAHTSSRISYTGPGSLGPHGLVTLALVVLVLTFCNAALKPILILFTLPFILLTAGLGLLVLNAGLFKFTAWVVPGFSVEGFWPAVWGGLVVSVMSFFGNRWGVSRRGVSTRVIGGFKGPSPARRRDDDVIDV
jgi:putative membrane protein